MSKSASRLGPAPRWGRGRVAALTARSSRMPQAILSRAWGTKNSSRVPASSTARPGVDDHLRVGVGGNLVHRDQVEAHRRGPSAGRPARGGCAGGRGPPPCRGGAGAARSSAIRFPSPRRQSRPKGAPCTSAAAGVGGDLQSRSGGRTAPGAADLRQSAIARPRPASAWPRARREPVVPFSPGPEPRRGAHLAHGSSSRPVIAPQRSRIPAAPGCRATRGARIPDSLTQSEWSLGMMQARVLPEPVAPVTHPPRQPAFRSTLTPA